MRRCPDKTIARIGAAALGLGAVLAVAERPVAAQAPRDLPTFPSQVELITVDAVVLDSSGKPVPDLTKEDFVVTEDGRPQEIASFESFVLEAPDVPPPPTAVASNETAGRASNGRAFAILVDDVRIAPDHTEMVRTAIASFLERGVRNGDLVSLRTTSGDVSWTARIPEGTEDLLAVLGRIKGRDVPLQSIDSMSEYEAFQIANREDSPAMSAEGLAVPASGAGGRTPAAPTAQTDVPGTGLGATKERVKNRWLTALLCIPANCDGLVRARAMEIDAKRRTRTGLTLAAVQRELAALALDRGRKSLLLLSDGFLEDFGTELREAAAASREANTAIYFLDLRGLIGKPGFGTAKDAGGFGLPAPLEQAGMRFEDSVLNSGGAETLADATGGFSVRHTNDLAGGMERIARESRVFYLLGFYPPPGKTAREWRNLQVSVRRPGLKVRARRGYTLQTEMDAPRVEKKGKPAGPDPVVARALEAAGDVAGIPMRAMAYVLEPRSAERVHVLVAAELDASRLSLERKADGEVGRVEVSVVAVSRDSGRGFRHDDVSEVRIPAGETPGWRALVREFELPPGVGQARVVVRDVASGAMGSVTQRFEVPGPGVLRLSTPILTDRVEPAPDPHGVPRPALAVHRVFAPGGGLYVQFEVFGAARKQGSPRVEAGLELWTADGHLARRVDPSLIAADAGGRVVREMGLSLEGMGEGPYDLVLDVHDEVSGARLKHRETFRLAREVASK